MSLKEKTYWINALWTALHDVHTGPRRWRVWNQAEDFFLPWIRQIEEFFYVEESY